MANLFDGLYRISLIVLIVVLVLTVVIGIGAFFYFRARKNKRKAKRKIDYSDFNRRDSKDYIMIEDITDDMIITDGGTRFIGVIDCQGYDFYSAHLLEQGNTVQSYLGFVNTIDKPMSYRQYSKSVDLEYTLKKYQDAYGKVCDKLDKAIKRQNEIQQALNNKMSPERTSLYISEQEITKRDVNALYFRKFHIEDQFRYINENSGGDTAPVVSSTYVFDWIYNPMEFSVDLTESEILERAKNELAAQANAKINSLSNSGVRAKRCNTVDLIDMCRRNSQPISSERYRIRDVMSSSYFDDITTTSSIREINEDLRNKLVENATAKLNEEFASMIDNIENDEEESVMLSSGSTEVGE